MEQKAQSHCDIFHQSGTETIDWTYNKQFWKKPLLKTKKVVDGDLDESI